jgi:hypothetical protein
MRGIKIVAVVAAAILVVGLRAGAAHADMANGSYSFDFTGIVPLWDISGSYSGDLGAFDLDFSIDEKVTGKLDGDGTFSVSGQSLDGPIYSIGGKTTGSSADPHVALGLRMSGTGTVDGKKVSLSLSANLHYHLDSSAGVLDHGRGTGTETITLLPSGRTFSTSGTFRPSDIPTLHLPDTATGGWMLSLDLTPKDGTKYSGTATIQTSTGETADFTTVTGTYDSTTDTSKIVLEGAAGDLTLEIATTGPTLTVNSAEGKLFGQTIGLNTQGQTIN